MRKSITPALFILISIIAISACKKSKLTDTSPSPGPGVYVVGDASNSTGSGLALWKNGQLVNIINNVLSGNTNAIAANGNDIYTIGILPQAKPAYFKNGGAAVPLDLGGYTTGGASCIAFQGNDMYIGGSVSKDTTGVISQAAYWKNGVLNVLPGDNAAAYDIAVSGSDVYFCGELISAGSEDWVYWKNGSQPIAAGVYGPNSIAANGNDVYIGGADSSGNPAYSKNGNSITVGSNGFVEHIAASSAGVYLSGQTRIHSTNNAYATYWNNNTATPLFNTTNYSYTGGICVNGSDVYVLGQAIDLTKNPPQSLGACYWMNGAPVQLTGATVTEVTGIVVIP